MPVQIRFLHLTCEVNFIDSFWCDLQLFNDLNAVGAFDVSSTLALIVIVALVPKAMLESSRTE